MKEYIIKSIQTKAILFQGHYPSMQSCLEDAFSINANLAHADLRKLDLSNLNLDEAELKHIDFAGSNLTGANFSEAKLLHCNFQNSDLYNTCLAYGTLANCSFDGASFGATDITQSTFVSCLFSNLTCFTLNFKLAKRMIDCRFADAEGTIIPLTEPPIIVHGIFDMPLIFMDGRVWRGHDQLPGRLNLPAILPKNRKILQ